MGTCTTSTNTDMSEPDTNGGVGSSVVSSDAPLVSAVASSVASSVAVGSPLSSQSHEATTAVYGGSPLAGSTAAPSLRAAKGMSFVLSKTAKTPAAPTRASTQLFLGRGRKNLVGTEPAAPAPSQPPHATHAQQWRGQTDAAQHTEQQYGNHADAPATESYTAAAPSVAASSAAAAAPSAAAATPNNEKKSTDHHDSDHVPISKWAAEDSDEEMDYSAPVVFADGTTTLTSQQRQAEEAQRKAHQLAEKQREAADRERVRLERAAAQAQIMAKQRLEQQQRERDRQASQAINPLSEVLKSHGSAPAWGGAQHVAPVPLVKHAVQQQSSSPKLQSQAHSQAAPPTLLARNQHDSPVRATVQAASVAALSAAAAVQTAPTTTAPVPAASSSSVPVAAVVSASPAPSAPIDSGEDQAVLMKQLAQRRRQEREAEIARLEQERLDRSKQKLLELERKQAEKLKSEQAAQGNSQPTAAAAAAGRHLFEPSAASSTATSKFDTNWRQEHHSVAAKDRDEYDRGYHRAHQAGPVKAVGKPASALSQAANTLLEQRTVTHQVHHAHDAPATNASSDASHASSAAAAGVVGGGVATSSPRIMQRPKSNSIVDIPPLTGEQAPHQHAAATHAKGATTAAISSRVRVKDAPPVSAAPIASKPAKAETNWRDESRVKQQSQTTARRPSVDAGHAKKGSALAPRPRIWADDLPAAVSAPPPAKAAATHAHPPAHTITMLGEAVIASSGEVSGGESGKAIAAARIVKHAHPAPISVPAAAANASIMPSVVSPRSMRGRLRGAAVAAGGIGASVAALSNASVASAAVVSAADATSAAYAANATPAVGAAHTNTTLAAPSLRGGRGGAAVRGGRGAAVSVAPSVVSAPAARGGKQPTVKKGDSPVTVDAASSSSSSESAAEKKRRDRDAKRADRLEKRKEDRLASKPPKPSKGQTVIIDGQEVYLSDPDETPTDTDGDASDFQKVLSKREQRELREKEKEAARLKEEQQQRAAEQQAIAQAKMEANRKSQEEARKKKADEREAHLAQKAANAAAAAAAATAASAAAAAKPTAPTATAPAVVSLTIGQAQIAEKMKELMLKQETSKAVEVAEVTESAPVTDEAAPAHDAVPAPEAVVAATTAAPATATADAAPAVLSVSTSSSAAPSVAHSPSIAPVPVGNMSSPLSLAPTADLSSPAPMQSSPSHAAQQAILANAAANPLLAMALLNAGQYNPAAAAAAAVNDQQQQIARLVQLQQQQSQVPMPLTPQQLVLQAQLVGLSQATTQQLLHYNSLLQMYGVTAFLNIAPSIGLNQHAIQQMQMQLNILQHNHHQQVMRERMQQAFNMQQTLQHHMQQQQMQQQQQMRMQHQHQQQQHQHMQQQQQQQTQHQPPHAAHVLSVGSPVASPLPVGASPVPAHPSMPLRAGATASVHAAPIAHTPAQTFTAPLVQDTTPTHTPTHGHSPINVEAAESEERTGHN